MKSLPVKTQDFLAGSKIFITSSGEYIVSEDMTLPEGFFLGADLPEEPGLYAVITSAGSFVIRVTDSGVSVFGSTVGSTPLKTNCLTAPGIEEINTVELVKPEPNQDFIYNYTFNGGMVEKEGFLYLEAYDFETDDYIIQCLNKETWDVEWERRISYNAPTRVVDIPYFSENHILVFGMDSGNWVVTVINYDGELLNEDYVLATNISSTYASAANIHLSDNVVLAHLDDANNEHWLITLDDSGVVSAVSTGIVFDVPEWSYLVNYMKPVEGNRLLVLEDSQGSGDIVLWDMNTLTQVWRVPSDAIKWGYIKPGENPIVYAWYGEVNGVYYDHAFVELDIDTGATLRSHVDTFSVDKESWVSYGNFIGENTLVIITDGYSTFPVARDENYVVWFDIENFEVTQTELIEGESMNGALMNQNSVASDNSIFFSLYETAFVVTETELKRFNLEENVGVMEVFLFADHVPVMSHDGSVYALGREYVSNTDGVMKLYSLS